MQNKTKNKKSSWKIFFFMFMAAMSTGNIFAPAPAEAIIWPHDCIGDNVIFGVCCRFDNNIEPGDFDFGSVSSTDLWMGRATSTDVANWGCIGLGSAFATTVCGTWEPIGERDIANGHRLMRGTSGNAVGHTIAFDFHDGKNQQAGIIGSMRTNNLGPYIPQQKAEMTLGFGAYFGQDTTGVALRNQPPVPAGVYDTPIQFVIYYTNRALGGNWNGNCDVMDKQYSSSIKFARITITEGCDIMPEQDINFGRFVELRRPRYAQGGGRVICTMGLNYSLKVTSQNNLKMKSGENELPYELYADSNHTDPWIMGMERPYEGKDSGLPQMLPIYAVLPSTRTQLKPGEYTDSLTVTVLY